MKKIKILHGFLVALIVLYIVHYYTMLFVMPNFINIFEKEIFGVSLFYFGFAFSIILFIGLIYTQMALFFVIKRGFFNSKSAYLFKIGGVLVLISGLLSFSLGLILIIQSKGEEHVIRILQSTPILIIGFSLLIVSDFIKKGGVMKQENELTI